jgi:hypothetical protein
MMRSAVYKTITLSWIAIVLAHWNNSLQVDMSPRHIILILNQPVLALSPQCCLLSREATNTNFIVFALTWSGLEPTTYHTWSEHANHYITDVVCFFWTSWYYINARLWMQCLISFWSDWHYILTFLFSFV